MNTGALPHSRVPDRIVAHRGYREEWPMEPMKPMSAPEIWWPKHLGTPSTDGAQNQMRYAFFPQEYVLLVEISGKLSACNPGNHKINGVDQQQSGTSDYISSQNEVSS
jgi:hypothetical protein